MPTVGPKKFPYSEAGVQMAKAEAAKTGQPLVKNYNSGGTVIANAKQGKETVKITQGHKGHKAKVTWG